MGAKKKLRAALETARGALRRQGELAMELNRERTNALLDVSTIRGHLETRTAERDEAWDRIEDLEGQLSDANDRVTDLRLDLDAETRARHAALDRDEEHAAELEGARQACADLREGLAARESELARCVELAAEHTKELARARRGTRLMAEVAALATSVLRAAGALMVQGAGDAEPWLYVPGVVGDRAFRGSREALALLCEELGPVVALSPAASNDNAGGSDAEPVLNAPGDYRCKNPSVPALCAPGECVACDSARGVGASKAAS